MPTEPADHASPAAGAASPAGVSRVGPSVVVMGVSGCGKSHIGAALAERLRRPWIEGDAYHSEANRALMHQGVPLTDAHRAAWLARLGELLAAQPAGAVLGCSALKRRYRDQLRASSTGLRFVWLDLDPRAAEARVAQRAAHFFPAALVATQFEALEAPRDEPDVLRVDALDAPTAIVEQVLAWLDDASAPCTPQR